MHSSCFRNLLVHIFTLFHDFLQLKHLVTVNFGVFYKHLIPCWTFPWPFEECVFLCLQPQSKVRLAASWLRLLESPLLALPVQLRTLWATTSSPSSPGHSIRCSQTRWIWPAVTWRAQPLTETRRISWATAPARSVPSRLTQPWTWMMAPRPPPQSATAPRPPLRGLIQLWPLRTVLKL